VTGPPIGQALGFILGPSLVGHPATASSGLPAVQRLLWFEAALDPRENHGETPRDVVVVDVLPTQNMM